jgi:hypothetical protein
MRMKSVKCGHRRRLHHHLHRRRNLTRLRLLRTSLNMLV